MPPQPTSPAFRFQNNPLINFDGHETYGPWQPPWFIETPRLVSNDQIGTLVIPVELEGRPDKIANQVYFSPFLDWVIIAFNAPQDVLNWPRAGAVIRYPKPELVFQYIN